VKVYNISALSIKNMEKSCKFYSRIPGFKVVYGGSNDDIFTTFKIGEDITMYLNLELRTTAILPLHMLTIGEILVE
jgi:catechol 2,3-dioxygenase-like lactoylglutathione lyase family enzyme